MLSYISKIIFSKDTEHVEMKHKPREESAISKKMRLSKKIQQRLYYEDDNNFC